jgi:serine/threonine protein kinase
MYLLHAIPLLYYCNVVYMYYMLFAAVPFTDQSETLSIAGQMRSIVEQPLNFPNGHGVSSEALQLLRQLLEKDPELRISLDAALLSPWLTSAKTEWPPSLKRLPSGLPDNDILLAASEQEVRHAVINVNNWSLVVKVKLIASRHVQGFRERKKTQEDAAGGGSTAQCVAPESGGDGAAPQRAVTQ